MTSVIPAWKQALIEKKRKKGQEEKAKLQVHSDRLAFLPEWKKALLSKKKGIQSSGEDTSVHYGFDEPNIGNNTVSEYDTRISQKRSSYGTNSLEREHEPSFDENSANVIIIPEGSSQNGTQGGIKKHSFVASSVSQSDQQRENKQLDEKLSNNSQENSTKRRTVPESVETDSKVSYEHIKTPSELRKLFGVVNRDTAAYASNSAESNKNLNQHTQSNDKDVSTSYRSSSPRDYEHGHKSTVNTHPQNCSRVELTSNEKEVVILNHEDNLPKSQTPAKTEAKDTSVITPSKKDNDTGHNTHLEKDSKLQRVNDEESLPEVHVNAIRNKFGPSGNFRFRSSSSDNLLKSKHQAAFPRNKERPLPISKRWSADVDGMFSSSKSTGNSDDEDISDSGHHNLQRTRSISMGDVRLDHHFGDSEPVVDLRHRASISSGIERRLQVLLHKLSVSDGNDDDENTYFESNFKDNIPDNFKINSTGTSGKQVEEEPPKIRKASWFDPRDEVMETTSISHSHSLNEKPAFSTNKTPSPGYKEVATSSGSNKSFNDDGGTENIIHIEKVKRAEGNNILENRPANKPTNKSFDSGRNVVVKDNEGNQICDSDEVSSNQESYESIQPAAHKTVVMNGEMSHVPAFEDSENYEKPKTGSVHKLSALFGSSISKDSKKAKPKTAKKDVTSKSVQEQQLNQENKSDKKKKEFKGSNSSRIFPWTKKQKKSEPVINVKEETFPFSGSGSLRPVQQKVIEQKITGNMTLVINADAESYTSKSKQKQPYMNRTGINSDKNVSGQNAQMNLPQSSSRNQKAFHKDDMMVTVIDVPDTNSTNDVQVSAIDLPEPPSPTPVSVIDIPESPEHDVKVSVIDIPDDEEDSDDSDSSGSCMSGSYDINPVEGSGVFIFNTISESTEEEEEEEDIDNVPVSYVGDSTYMVVPKVMFDSKVEDVKSCLSSPLCSRKRKAKVVFHPESLTEVHDYPSEKCMQSHYDQYLKENGEKTIDQYRPTSMQSLEETLRLRQTESKEKENNASTGTKQKGLKSSDISQVNNNTTAPRITYLDQGQGFTNSSSSSGALLF